MNMKKTTLAMLSLFMSWTAGAQTLKDAIRYSDREQYEKSKGILQNLVKTDLKSTDQYYYLGDLYYKNEQYDSARYWFKQAVKLNENSALNYAGLGKVTYAENPTEGKANFDKAISLAKKDGRVYAALAEYYLAAEKPAVDLAIQYATKAVEIEPKNASLKLVLADAHLANNDGSSAMAQYKAAANLDPKSPLPQWKIGKLYLGAKNYDLGMQHFKEGLELDAEFAPIYREMGELYYRAKKFDKAIESYKQYLELRDKNDEANFRYASFLFLNEDYTNALNILNDLDKRKYANPILYRLIGYSYYETKNYDKAKDALDTYWKKADTRKTITQDYEYYGKTLAKKGQDSLAVDFLTKALERDTSKKELYGEIANIWFLAKRYDKAALAFGKKIEAYKETAKPTALANDYLSMGRSYMFARSFVEADSAFAKVVELKSDLPIGYLYRARASANLDPNQSQALAKPHYEKYIELAKADAEKNKRDLVEAYTYLGSYYLFVSKDKSKADEAWSQVRVLDPSNRAAAEAAKVK
jgi:tetratricopeptide (TPR) repeat protein